MVMSPDPHLNLRADIKATYQSLGARIQIGGNWRSCADVARELGHKLDALAEMEQFSDQPRYRRIEPPPVPTEEEFLGPRLAAIRRAARARREARRIEVTEVKRSPPELPSAS